MKVSLGSLGIDCSDWWTDVLNPSCWFTDPMGIKPSLAVVQASCTSGTSEQMAACRAGVAQAQKVADEDPEYSCAMSDYQLLCSMGLANPDGTPKGSSMLLLLAVGAFVYSEIRK